MNIETAPVFSYELLNENTNFPIIENAFILIKGSSSSCCRAKKSRFHPISSLLIKMAVFLQNIFSERPGIVPALKVISCLTLSGISVETLDTNVSTSNHSIF